MVPVGNKTVRYLDISGLRHFGTDQDSSGLGHFGTGTFRDPEINHSVLKLKLNTSKLCSKLMIISSESITLQRKQGVQLILDYILDYPD